MSDRTIPERLARIRVPLGFVFGGLVFWLAAPTPATLLAGAPIAAFGEMIRIWAAGHLNKAREVTASGPYRWLGHPLYVGSAVMGAGLAIACASVVVTALIVVYVVVMFTVAVRNEEAFLRRTFGDRYERYRRDSFVDDRRRFSLALVLANREHRALVGLALAVLLLAWKATYNEMFWWTAGTRIVRPGG